MRVAVANWSHEFSSVRRYSTLAKSKSREQASILEGSYCSAGNRLPTRCGRELWAVCRSASENKILWANRDFLSNALEGHMIDNRFFLFLGLVVTIGQVLLPKAQAQGDIDLTGYTLVFEENFDTLSVAQTDAKGDKTWYFFPPYGPAGAYSFSHWSVENTMSCANGILTNTAWWDNTIQNHWTNWRSGNLSSMDKTRSGFARKYGYFAARIKMPNAGRGAWPAFWLASVGGIPNGGTKGLEVDIVEWYGNDQSGARQSVHPWNADGSQGPLAGGGRAAIPGGDAINQWHIYGAKIDPVNITFYVDGIQTRQMPTPNDYLEYPLYMMVDYALGGGWPVDGAPFNTHGSSSMYVDWIRAYKLPDHD